jgi:hypothetical protein
MIARRLCSIFFAALALTAISATASADPAAKPAPGKAEQGYAYTFDDDPLSAPGMGATNAIIKVRPKASRNTLTRPRLHFIPEMLKSVEAL